MSGIMTGLITAVYYALVAYVSGLLIYSLAKSRSWEKELLYIIVLIPFLLRLFMLK